MNNQKNELRLSAGFYEFSDSLRFIRDEAIHRMVAPDALLFSLLARISAAIPPSYVLPAFVGSQGTPSVCSAIVGNAGIGKSQANSAARELFPFEDDRFAFDLPNGTGQGMIEAYLRAAKKGEAGYEEGLKIQRRLGCHFYIDEGSNLVALAQKTEDITLDTIRSLWSGETVGQTNASSATSRYLPARAASFGLSVGFQPDIAALFITKGAGVGTPQRFLWCYAHNQDQPTFVEKPKGFLSIKIPAPRDSPFQFRFDPSIEEEVRDRRAKCMRLELVLDPLETHNHLKQIKVAACLAVLHNETHVDTQRWALAGNIVEVSNNVLNDIREEYAAKESARQAAQHDLHAQKTVRTIEKTTEQAMKAGAATLARKVHKEVGLLTRTQVNHAVSSGDKNRASLDDMIEYAIRQQWIEEIRQNSQILYKAGRGTPPTSAHT
jgi:hypothetical protein